ncbi:MAG: zinc ribbon domain-containing protein [Candidatus Bathyarchaeia archaeon]
MARHEPPGRPLWVPVGAGLLVSLVVGTLTTIVNVELIDLGTFVGAFLGGLLAGQMIIRPLRRTAFAGGVVALLSFFAYFPIVPLLIEAGLIELDVPAPDPNTYWALFFGTLGVFLVLGAAGGVAGGYIKGRTRPRAVIPGRCLNCNFPIPDEAVFCPYCGKRVERGTPAAHEW